MKIILTESQVGSLRERLWAHIQKGEGSKFNWKEGDIEKADKKIVPLSKLKFNQPKGDENEKEYQDKVDGIIKYYKKHKKLMPMFVHKIKGGYRIIDGHHRYSALKQMGIKDAKVIVIPAKDIKYKKKLKLEENMGMVTELGRTFHFDERMMERMYFDMYEVVFVGEYEGEKIRRVVGKYKLTDEARMKIREKIDILGRMDFPMDEQIGFIVHHFDINGVNDIIFDNPNDKIWLKKVMSVNENPLFFILDPTRDYSDYRLAQVAMVLIKGNKLITVMYKTISKLTPYNSSEFDYIGDDINDIRRHYNM
jgi:hypothetical protein